MGTGGPSQPNTAKTLQMQTDYVVGRFGDAEQLAKGFLKSPPPKGDEFANSDSKLIALEVLKLCAHERGKADEVASNGQQAADYRRDYIGVEHNLTAKRRLYTASMSR